MIMIDNKYPKMHCVSLNALQMFFFRRIKLSAHPIYSRLIRQQLYYKHVKIYQILFMVAIFHTVPLIGPIKDTCHASFISTNRMAVLIKLSNYPLDSYRC